MQRTRCVDSAAYGPTKPCRLFARGDDPRAVLNAPGLRLGGPWYRSAGTRARPREYQRCAEPLRNKTLRAECTAPGAGICPGAKAATEVLD
jgi:hypothetical protein